MSDSATATRPNRNEPCHCGSGKKFKRCHGIDSAPKLSQPKINFNSPGFGAPEERALPAGGGAIPGFDPSQMDPAVLQQFTSAIQRLPRGQMQRLQSIMQKAMAGKDVTREAADFERTLPAEFQSLMQTFKGAMPAPEPEMSAEEAKAIIEKAMAEGKVSKDEAETLLSVETPAEEKKGFWKRLTGKGK